MVKEHIKYKLLEHVSLTEVGDEAVLLDLNTGAYFGLNHVGVFFINLMQAGDSLKDASKKLAECYQIAPSEVSADLTNLLRQLMEQNLICEITVT